MLKNKSMPHRGHILTLWKLEHNIIYINTLRHSSKKDVEGLLTISPVSGNIFKITMTEGKVPPQMKSLAVVNSGNNSDINVSVKESDTHLELLSEQIKVVIRKKDCTLSYFTADGKPLLKEWTKGGKWLRNIDVMVPEKDSSAEMVIDNSIDGMKVRTSNQKKVKDREGYNVNLHFELEEDEAVYGLGQHEEGILNYRNHYQFLYQENMKVAMPMFVSTKGYALFWDTMALSTFDDTNEITTIDIDVCDRLEYYFVYGPEFDNIVAGMRLLSGGMPMLPKWAYGYFQSKERYESAAELEETVKGYRDRNLPLDCIILDWKSWEENLWGQKSFDLSRFPDPSKMMDNIHEMNAKMLISIWPNMAKGGADNKEMCENNCMLSNGATYDAFDPKARATYWKQVEQGLFKHGIDGWWCDCTEPFEADWCGEMKLSAFKRMQMNIEEQKKYIDPALLNAYSLEHSRGLYEGQRNSGSSKRMINLTRSGSIGQQRYGTVTWSGDIEARWSRLRKQLADGLNFTVTGNPRWTFDIGAFFSKPSVQWFWDGQYPEGNRDLGYRELYVRWLQTGSFLPMFRSHGTDTCREAWFFGDPGTPFYDAIKKGIELRCRLMPYIYSLAGWEVYRDYTMFRNLAFDFRHDRKVHDIKDQFMFGPALMVCPVFEPMLYGPDSTPLVGVEQSRMVYLPKGREWYDFYTHERYEGGQTIKVAAPLDRIPLFVPAGSIIPTGPISQYVDEHCNALWDILVFPGQDANFDIYEDSDDGYGYEQGEYAWRSLVWNNSSRDLDIGPVDGTFPGLVNDRKFNLTIV